MSRFRAGFAAVIFNTWIIHVSGRRSRNGLENAELFELSVMEQSSGIAILCLTQVMT